MKKKKKKSLKLTQETLLQLAGPSPVMGGATMTNCACSPSGWICDDFETAVCVTNTC